MPDKVGGVYLRALRRRGIRDSQVIQRWML